MNRISETGTIEPTELARLLESKAVRLLDATYGSHDGLHIPGALAFDIDAVADQDNPLPHMLPSPEEFADAAGKLGISNDTPVVIYDRSGIAMAAARVWWTFRVFGHDNIRVLDGGLPAWAAAGFAVEAGPLPDVDSRRGYFKPHFRPELVADRNRILAAVEKEQPALIIDARSAERFSGIAPEPRPGMRSGHIPRSRNIPYVSVIDPHTGRLLPSQLLHQMFNAFDKDTSIITSCGSGVTACVLALALFRTGRTDVAVYDGSWMEWGNAASETPVVCER